MRREFFKLIPLLFLITPAFSQESDSLIFAEGNIISAETKEPVKARITYQSEPYGNMVGVINNTAYSFPMFELEKYSIVVEAPGYQLAKYLIDPAEAKGERKLVRNIELSKGNYVTGQRVAVGNVIRLENLIFQVGRTKISPESYEELDVVAKMMQDNNTDDMIFEVPFLVSYISQFMTLLPGDVISTGTPAGVGLGFTPPIYLKRGDVIELGIEGLGEQKQLAV